MTQRRRMRVLAVGLATAAALAAPAAATAALQPLLQIGGTGTGAGQLDGPSGIDFGPNGEVYVGESSNRRISQLSPTGGFVRAWGIDVVPGNAETGFEICTAATGCQAGSSAGASASIAGATRSTQGVVVASDGDVYSIDNFNARIDHFTGSGEFVAAFGLDVVPGNAETGLETCTAATGCKQGGFATGAGGLGDGFELAIGPADQLYAIHANNRRVNEFTTAGQFVRGWGHDVIPGNAETGLEVCTTATGCKSGTSGGAAGQFNGPRGIGVAANGDVLVSNAGRIDEFTPSGGFVRAWAFDVAPGGGTGLEVCTTATGCKLPVTGGAAGQLDSGTNGIAGAPDGSIWIADSLGDRVNGYDGPADFRLSFGFDVDPAGGTGFETCTPATGCKAAVDGTGTGQFSAVKDVAVDCRGAIWTTDGANDRVTRFGEPGTPSCAPPDPPPPTPDDPREPPPPAKPSNQFALGVLKLDRDKGTARLTVELPGPGDLRLAGNGLKPATADAAGGPVALALKPSGRAKRKLREDGKATVQAEVTFTPVGGDANTLQRRVKLKRRR